MLLTALANPKPETHYRPLLAFAKYQKTLLDLQKALTLIPFNQFQIKTAEPYHDGFITVWHIPKAGTKQGIITVFRAAFRAATSKKGIDDLLTNQKPKAKPKAKPKVKKKPGPKPKVKKRRKPGPKKKPKTRGKPGPKPRIRVIKTRSGAGNVPAYALAERARLIDIC